MWFKDIGELLLQGQGERCVIIAVSVVSKECWCLIWREQRMLVLVVEGARNVGACYGGSKECCACYR